MKATIKNNVLLVEIPLQVPRPSTSGKTLTVATTRGNRPTEAKVNGKPVIIGLNAYIDRDLNASPQPPTPNQPKS